MLSVRKSSDRGHARHGWLDSYHTFSFADYYDPAEMGFSSLRVINEDRIAPGAGFPTHPHRDMEIITYVLEGALEHRDSLGNGSQIRPGEVQRMSAGTGISHSEYNASPAEPVHLLQIWILPAQAHLAPGYEQKRFPIAEEPGRMHLLAAPDGRDGAVTVHQDCRLYGAVLQPGMAIDFPLDAKRSGYLHLARGTLRVGELNLSAGDGLKIREENALRLSADGTAELLFFDLP